MTPAPRVDRAAIVEMLVARDDAAHRVIASWPLVSATLLGDHDRLGIELSRLAALPFREVMRVLTALRAHQVLRDDLSVDPEAVRVVDAAYVQRAVPGPAPA